ncbi:MAG: MarR family transcriptional regulator [Lachnospiraceae bacterium]|nr:MarR family transcriptional regulator [Lachnospiraceae bacterium]
MDHSTHFIFHYLGRRRGQGRILRMLNEHGDLTQQELQCKLNIQSGSLSEILAKLESVGFIKRERDESDKRRVIVSITEAGLEDLRQHESIRLKRQAVLYDCLSPEEQDEMIRILTKLQHNWAELPPQCEQYHSCHPNGGSKP